MHSPRKPPRATRLLLLTGTLLGTGMGCTQPAAPAEKPSFRTFPAPAVTEKGELHPLRLRAREVMPSPGVADSLRERWAEAVKRGDRTLHFIAQLSQTPNPELWEKLRWEGIHRAAFLHGRSYIIGVDIPEGAGDDMLYRVQEMLGALALLPFEPEDRTPPALLKGEFSEAARVEGTGLVRVHVTLFPETSKEVSERLIELAHRGKDVPERPDETTLVLETDGEGIRALIVEDAVYDVAEQPRALPLLERVRASTGADVVQGADFSGPQPVYNGLSGLGVRISLGVESIDSTHPDFVNRVEPACASPLDTHGTHVGGIVMGNGSLSGGRYRGMAPQATAVCYGGTTTDVSNHSYVTGGLDGWYYWSDASDDAAMHDASSPNHHLHVRAVGNNGLTAQYGSLVGYYSSLSSSKNSLTVANVDSADFRWGGSSQGPTFDGRLKPDIAAPGSLHRFPEVPQVLFELDSVTVNSAGGPITWDFNTPNDNQGWADGGGYPYREAIGTLQWNPVGSGYALGAPLLPDGRPYLATLRAPSGGPLSINGQAGDTVSVRYRFEPTPLWSGEKGAFWWAAGGSVSLLYFPITPDGQWHTATVDVGQYPDWRRSGIDMVRISPVAYTQLGVISTLPGSTYGASNGSSMAAPAVTGATALLLQQVASQFNVNLMNKNADSPYYLPSGGRGVPMPSTFKAVLLHTARDLSTVPHPSDHLHPDTGSVTRYHKGPDLTTGYGELDVAEAVRLMQSGTSRIVENELQSGVFHGYPLQVDGGGTVQTQPLKVTLVWDDPAGSPALAPTQSQLVNDLDLVLVDPNGQFFYPWTVPALNGPTAPIAASDIQPARQDLEDHLNNVEQVYVENPTPGLWSVQVGASSMPLSPQRYSLVLGMPPQPAPHLTGGKVAWTSNRVSPPQIFTRENTAGSGILQLTAEPAAARQPAWSPSGDYLAYVTHEPGNDKDALVIVDAFGNAVARYAQPLNTKYLSRPAWSWDARHIAVSFYDVFGCSGLGVVDFANPQAFTTATTRVLVPADCDPSHPAAMNPEFSHDAAFIYFHDVAGHPASPGRLSRIALSGGALETVYADGAPVRRGYDVSISPDGKHAVYNSELYRENATRYWDEEVIALDTTTGTSTQLTHEAGNQYAYYAMGGDGEMLLQSGPMGGNPEFFLVENSTRLAFDIGDPSNSFEDKYPSWWKRAPHCLAAPSGLRAWYPLDWLWRGQFFDLAGGGIGSAVGSVLDTGMVRQGLRFNGVSAYGTVPHQSQLNVGTGDFTLAFWVRQPVTSGTQVILDKRQDTPLRGYHLVSSNGCMLLQLADGTNGGWGNYGSSVCITDGAWHHVAVTVRRNSATGLQWYLDGAASTTSNPTGHQGSLDSTSPLLLGRRSTVDADGFFNGMQDEVMLFNRALPAAEVQALVDAGPSGLCR